MFRKYGGRLLIVAAGGGCLALVFFGVAPRLFEPAPPMPQEEIVTEALETGERGESQAVTPVYTPLVGARNDGADVAVIFPAAEEKPREESWLPPTLSSEDVAEARAALAGREPEPVVVVEPDSASAIEEETDTAILPQEVVAQVVPPVVETSVAVDAERTELDSTAGREDEAALSALPAPLAEAVEAAPEPVAVAAALPVERVSAGGHGRPGNALRLADRRGEFAMPVSLDSRAPLEVSHPSRGAPEDDPPEAARAGESQSGLSPRTMRTGVIVPGTLRGVMGYRLPLISRQEVPDQIVSGVLIPAHTTFVILKEGSWELLDVTPEELERFREAAARPPAPVVEAKPVRKGWNPLSVFRKRAVPATEQKDVEQKKR